MTDGQESTQELQAQNVPHEQAHNIGTTIVSFAEAIDWNEPLDVDTPLSETDRSE